MRKLVRSIAAALAVLVGFLAPTNAHAEVGVGLFVGEPSGFDLDIGLSRRSQLDIVLGWTSFRDNRLGYGHVTYLVTPVTGQGDAVRVPVRLGIGLALYGTRHDVDVAVRAPLEIALRFRRSPLELYGEIALAVTIADPHGDTGALFDLQAGIGLRVFF